MISVLVALTGFAVGYALAWWTRGLKINNQSWRISGLEIEVRAMTIMRDNARRANESARITRDRAIQALKEIV